MVRDVRLAARASHRGGSLIHEEPRTTLWEHAELLDKTAARFHEDYHEPARFLLVSIDPERGSAGRGRAHPLLPERFAHGGSAVLGVAINLIPRRSQTVDAVTVEVSFPGDKFIDRNAVKLAGLFDRYPAAADGLN